MIQARKLAVWLPPVVITIVLLLAMRYVRPTASRNPLWETATWGGLVLTAFVGWGSLLREVICRKIAVDLGLRAIWGAAVLCGIGGMLMALDAMKRTQALLLVDAGVVLAALSAFREKTAAWHELRFWGRLARREPKLALVAAVVVGLLLLLFLGSVADWHVNPYDDDIAYLGFVRRLMDTGTILEPFSLRRLSALGGQIFFLELVGMRADPRQQMTFDHGICLVLVAMLVAGHRAKNRRASLLMMLLAVLVLATAENVAINTASYFSGVAFFLGMYRTLVWAGSSGRPVANAVALGLISAGACTLRQNYIAVPVVCLGWSYASLAWSQRRRPWRALGEGALVAVVTAVVLLPWLLVAKRSNLTFLYPLWLGTARPAAALAATDLGFFDELKLQLGSFVDALPIHSLGLFALAAAVIRERDPRKPLWSVALAGGLGLFALAHSLTQGDPGNIGRYAYGFLSAFVVATMLAAGTSTLLGAREAGRARVAVGLAIVAASIALVDARTKLRPALDHVVRNVGVMMASAPRSEKTDPPEVKLYAQMQAVVPAGERLAVAVDEPFRLDYVRNPIWNLDMPGYSSLPPGMPFFTGSDALEAYYRGIGVRYVAFMERDTSRYYYRREYWLELLNNEEEIWRTHAPYIIDFLDNMEDLSRRHPRIFERRGILVVDLGRP